MTFFVRDRCEGSVGHAMRRHLNAVNPQIMWGETASLFAFDQNRCEPLLLFMGSLGEEPSTALVIEVLPGAGVARKASAEGY